MAEANNSFDTNPFQPLSKKGNLEEDSPLVTLPRNFLRGELSLLPLFSFSFFFFKKKSREKE